MSTLPVRIRVDNHEAVDGTLEMGTDVIDTTSLGGTTRPNLAWEMVDPAGHFHAWDRDGGLPTLASHTVHMDCEGGHDMMDEECQGWNKTIYACLICGWEVEPVTITNHAPTSAPGRSWWTVVTAGLDLEMYHMAKVSVVISAGDGAAKYFGVATVISTGLNVTTSITHMATLQGTGALGRKR